ncbi:hypothetical protein [Proteus vulgaris]|uniref:hypothetical protein n=1 Tax=Proteus vulgaris TaxID=585 RepID=UPI003C7AF189
MSVSDTVATVMIVIIISVAIFSLAYSLTIVGSGIIIMRLEKKIKLGIEDHDLDFADLKNLLDVHNVSDKSAVYILKRIKADNDSGRHPNRIDIKKRINQLLEEIIKEEPFSDFPLNLRSILNEVSFIYKESKIINELVIALREDLRNQNRISHRLKILTYIGAVVGVIGLIIGVIGLVITK